MFAEVKKNFGFGLMRLPMKKEPDVLEKNAGEESRKRETVDIEQLNRMVDSFIGAGFNYFDTAHGYLDGLSELAFKECVALRYPREKYVIANKLSSPYFKKNEDIRPLFEEQLSHCGVSYFDFYLMHAQDTSTYEKFKNCRAYETAFELKKEGKIRHVGLSFHDSADVLDRILTDYPDVEMVQIQFNYADYADSAVQAGKVYEVCRKHGKPSIVMEPVKGGNLVDLPESCQKILDDFQKERGTAFSNSSYALRFAATFDNNFMVLSGMSSLEQMQDNISAMAEFKPLDKEEMRALEKVSLAFNALNSIPCTSCHYCVRDSHCPKDLQIPELFACYNKKKCFKSWNQDMYYFYSVTAGHGKASDCIKCGKCESVCPQHLPIRALLEDVAAEFERSQA